MKLMFPKLSFLGSFIALIALSLTFSTTLNAQKKKNTPAKKADTKKTQAKAKDAKKDRDKGRDSAKNKRDKDKKEKASAKTKDRKKDNDHSKSKDRDRDRADSRSKNDARSSRAERRKADAERRQREAERRAAALAEARRREQARREAIARKIAFENGLRTETVANISKDNIDGEDLNIRAAAVRALGGHAGSVVVMEAQTGKVLTIVNQDWAVRSSIRPCSTIKLVTGVAGLNEGVISKEDGSVKNVATRRNLDTALAYSDNGYFQRAGVQMGNEKLVEYGKKLGLGEQTGINLEGETPGRLPYSNKNARIYSHGDDTEVSTLQLAVMAAAITNGGRKVLPRVPRNNVDKADFRTFYKGTVDLPSQNVRRVIPGMMGAAEYGTARRNMDQNLGVAGKTGSCIDKGSWVGLFASVAPIERPKYAVAVITRGQRERGRYAAGIAAQIYSSLSNGIVRTDRNLAQTEFKLAPKKVETSNAATLAAMEDSEDSDTDVETTGNVIVVPSAPRLSNPDTSVRQKLVTRTGDSKPTKPLFAPVIITPGKKP